MTIYFVCVWGGYPKSLPTENELVLKGCLTVTPGGFGWRTTPTFVFLGAVFRFDGGAKKHSPRHQVPGPTEQPNQWAEREWLQRPYGLICKKHRRHIEGSTRYQLSRRHTCSWHWLYWCHLIPRFLLGLGASFPLFFTRLLLALRALIVLQFELESTRERSSSLSNKTVLISDPHWGELTRKQYKVWHLWKPMSGHYT